MAFIDNTEGGRVIKQGVNPVKITLTDTCNVGDPIGFDAVTANVWKRADANDKIYADLIAGEKCKASGDEITCYRMAVIAVPPPYAVPLVPTAAIPGKPVYLSDEPGEYADNPVTTWSQALGMFISVDEMFVVPNTIPPAAYAGHAVQGVYFRTEIEALATAEVLLAGLRVDLKTLATAVITDAFGLYLFMQMKVAPNGASAMLRMDDGCDGGCHPESFVVVIPGSVGPTYLLDIGSYTTPSGGSVSSAAESKSGAGGWLAVKTNDGTRYINLYTP